MEFISPAWIVLIILALIVYALAVRIVPQQSAHIVELCVGLRGWLCG